MSGGTGWSQLTIHRYVVENQKARQVDGYQWHFDLMVYRELSPEERSLCMLSVSRLPLSENFAPPWSCSPPLHLLSKPSRRCSSLPLLVQLLLRFQLLAPGIFPLPLKPLLLLLLKNFLLQLLLLLLLLEAPLQRIFNSFSKHLLNWLLVSFVLHRFCVHGAR